MPMTLDQVRQQFPQYQGVDDETLAQGLHQKFYSSMPYSQFAAQIGHQIKTPQLQPNTGLAGPLGSALETAAAPLDTIASGVSHAASAVIDPIAGLAARGKALLTGQDPSAAADAAHQWVADKGTYRAVTPGGRAVGNAVEGAVGKVTQPLSNAAGTVENSAENATGLPHGSIEHAAGLANDVLGTLPVAGAVGDAARTLRAPAAMQVARGASDVASEAGYTGLHTRADLKTPGAQAITDQLISHDAKLLPGQAPSVANVQNARAVGPGRVYDRAEASMPPQLTADATLQQRIRQIGDDTSQLPRSPDVDALRSAMLNQPNMTSRELFANIRAARARAGSYLGSDNPDQVALGHAYNQLAEAYEDFAGQHMPASGVPMDQWRNARTDFAKSYLAEAALKGGEHFDPAVYARAAQKDPNLLTGGAKVVADTYNGLPGEGDHALSKAVGSVAGAGAGVLADHALGGTGIGGGTAGAVIGHQAAPAVQDAVRRFFTRGDPQTAAAAPGNPRLSYFYEPDAPGPRPRGELTPPPGNAGGPPPQQLSLGDLVQGHGPAPFTLGEGVNPGGTPSGARPGDIPLGELLSHGVEQGAPQGLSVGPMGAPAQGGLPFSRNAAHEAGGLELAPEDSWFTGGKAPERLGDFAAVASQGVPEGTMTRTASRPKGTQPTIEYPSGAQTNSRLTNNASGESAASVEAINRGTRDLVQVDPDGNETPVLRDVTQIDRRAPKGHLLVDRSNGEIVDRGGLTQRLAEGLRNRWASNVRLGDSFAPAR